MVPASSVSQERNSPHASSGIHVHVAVRPSVNQGRLGEEAASRLEKWHRDTESSACKLRLVDLIEAVRCQHHAGLPLVEALNGQTFFRV